MSAPVPGGGPGKAEGRFRGFATVTESTDCLCSRVSLDEARGETSLSQERSTFRERSFLPRSEQIELKEVSAVPRVSSVRSGP